MTERVTITNTKTGEITYISPEITGEQAAKDFAYCFRMIAKIGAGARLFHLCKTEWLYGEPKARRFDFYMKGISAPLHYHYLFIGSDVE